MRYDAMAAGVRLLAAAGADVVVLPLGAGAMFGDDIVLDDDLDELAAPLPARSGALTLIEELDGAQVADALADGAIDDAWAAAVARLGGVDCVYLGDWYGFTAFEVGRRVLELLADGGGGELVVTEAHVGADQKLRWYDRWTAEAGGTATTVSVVVEPRHVAPSTTTASATVAGVLRGAGWEGPFTIADAEAWSREQRRQGDALAGELWRDVGVEHVDSGRVVVGDASAPLDAALVDVLQRVREGYVEDLSGDGAPFWEASTVDGDAPVGVEVAPVDGDVHAIRLMFGSDALEGVAQYVTVGSLALRGPDARVRMSDPAYLDASPGRVLDVLPGQWVVDEIWSDAERLGVRFRHANRFDPAAFEVADAWDDRAVAFVIAESLDWDPEGSAAVASCVLDREGRRPLVALRDGRRYGIGIRRVDGDGGTSPAPVDDADALGAVVDELLRVQTDDDRTIDTAVVHDGAVAEVAITGGPGVLVWLERPSAERLADPDAHVHPADVEEDVDDDPPICPACGELMWTIRYGMPTAGAAERANEERVILGGCVKDFSRMGPVCVACGYEHVFRMVGADGPWRL